jgi:hypothetical protein
MPRARARERRARELRRASQARWKRTLPAFLPSLAGGLLLHLAGQAQSQDQDTKRLESAPDGPGMPTSGLPITPVGSRPLLAAVL